MRKTALLAVLIATVMVVPIAAFAIHSFTDVPDSAFFSNSVTWMKDNGITVGCNPPANTEYCPNDNVSRGEMAVFLKRLSENKIVDAATAVNATNADALEGFGKTDFLGMSIRQVFVEVLVPDGSAFGASAEASCDAGEVLIGGGGSISVFVSDVQLLSSRPAPIGTGLTITAWRVTAINPAGGTVDVNVRAQALCASLPGTFVLADGPADTTDTP